MSAQDPENPDKSEAVADVRPQDLRAEPRASMLLTGSLRRASGEDLLIKIRNLSGGGLMAETPVSLLKEEHVEVELRGLGVVPGKVAWAIGRRAGITFDHVVDHILARRPIVRAPQQQLVRPSLSTWRPGLRG